MALVHSCTHGYKGPRTLNNFCSHLKVYGIETDPDEVSNSKLGDVMRSLGLVLDSPDAEGGITLINPFNFISDRFLEMSFFIKTLNSFQILNLR